MIKNGINIFNDMYNNLKLKTTNDVWFFYISNGDILDMYKNVDVILLKKNIHEQECNYNISKTSMDIEKNISKEIKLERVQELKSNFENLFMNPSILKYDKLFN